RARPAALDVAEQALEVALEAGAVVALEAAQFVDLVLEHVALGLKPRHRAVAHLFGLAAHALPLGAGLADEAVRFGLTVRDVLVVEALGELEHAGGRLGLALVVARNAGRGGRSRGDGSGYDRGGGDRGLGLVRAGAG